MTGRAMKRTCVTFLEMLLSVMLVVPLNSQTVNAETPQESWIKTCGGTNRDGALALVETSDGGYAFAGWTLSFGAGSSDAWLVKTDASGTMQWNRTYGGTSDDSAYAVVQTSDGGYALAGSTSSFGTGNNDFWLVKTDVNGNVQWNKTYGGRNPDEAYALVQASDGGYAMVGRSFSLRNDSGQELWLVKTDSSGAMQWNRTYNGTNVSEGMGRALVQTADGGYAVVGQTGVTTSNASFGNSEFWLVKTDASGDAQWNRTYGGRGYELGRALAQTSDGGYALAGLTSSFGAGNNDFWLVKIDAAGTMMWNRTYGGTSDDSARAVVQTSDGGYALAGITSSFGAGNEDSWLVKTDLNGNVQWNKTYGGTENDETFALVQTSDGGYAFAGWTLSFGAGNLDFWLVRADASGVVPEYPIPTDAWTVDREALLILAAGLAVTSFVVILAKKKFRGSPRKPH
jgi:hypothetical protein